MSWTVGVDVGGTFTDFYAIDESTGEIHVGKTPSTPDNPARAIVDGLRALSDRFGFALSTVSRLSHGTTVGTNALIQRRGGKVALITTGGFRDLLEIGRQTRPHMFDLYMDHPQPLVPRERRIELNERVGPAGEVIRAPSEEDIEIAVREALASGAQAIAVGCLFSFRNPAHEQKVGAAIRDTNSDTSVSLSCEVQPEFREYERLSTTVLNAYLQPVMTEYLHSLESEVSSIGPHINIGINQSSGGLMSPARARALPVRTALSGPAAGAVGAAHVAQQTERTHVITLDMGGTSADVALIRDFQADIAFERDVAGFPLRLPSVDIETVGAGGGSIAWFDRDGLLKAGPISAGAAPGPACYGLGGDQPTVTDANLLLGRLSPRGLLDGEMSLDVDLSREAFQPIADRLGFSLERTAHGLLGIVVANMVRTIRTISVERGHDPREFVLMPFGGAGPLHARDVALSLGMKEIVVPAAPGIVCAQGLVVSELKEDFVLSERVPLDAQGTQSLEANLSQLAQRATAWFDAEDVSEAARHAELSIDARYVGQNFELTVGIGQRSRLSELEITAPEAIRQLFEQAHEQAYGYASSTDPVEVVNLRLSARAPMYEEPASSKGASEDASEPAYEERLVYFDAESPATAKVYQRTDLKEGQQVVGPAIIEQLDTTTPIYPGDTCRVTAHGHLIIEMVGA